MHFLMTFLILFFGQPDQSFDWVSFKMVKRTTSNGAVTSTEADVYYSSDGAMVTRIVRPTEIYMLNNAYGEFQIYNPQSNSVVRSVDNRMASEHTSYISFLLGRAEDMGLEAAGFVLRDSRVEDMMLISEYQAPADAKGYIDFVELVSNGDYPIFMGYVGKDGSYVKKVFYYDFESVANAECPMSITEIDFIKGDSVLSKTTFSDFKFDRSEDAKMVNFEIPENAKLIK